ncbi:hypothetical protein DOTSEDRAFT_74884 [Dothistroma septosporum NZE10]|uniref:Uncharacterized protein n=1 Tax=Dothistroma septosporum (strain NZE10 / CBS 128990) TaxID=675120 RepID=N1PDP5_DOTSN|nr:hypothetical protein DOTSEDRAFT_74884 [Dothistroma septosporum NZE10]
MALHTICGVQQDYVKPQILFIIEFLIMSLHVSLDDIQSFSSKSGEDEARKVYPRVRAWTEDAESRRTVCHAGQVLRIAQTFEKTGLRDFYAVAAYQATLKLWVHGMVTSNAARRNGEKTPVVNRPAQTSAITFEAVSQASHILLDDEGDKASKSFKLLGHGVPGLRTPGLNHNTAQNRGFCSLHGSKGLMFLAQDILKRSFPESRNGLLPLVENLANLMNELGKLSGK